MADPRGALGPIFFIFMQFLANILRTGFGSCLPSPSPVNPGFATGQVPSIGINLRVTKRRSGDGCLVIDRHKRILPTFGGRIHITS